MDFLELLLISKKLHFTDGNVTFYGQHISIAPPTSMAEYILQSDGDINISKAIYKIAKKTMMDNTVGFLDAYNKQNVTEWIVNTINLYSIGKIRYENDKVTLIDTIYLENSVIANTLKGKVKFPSDHIMRGIVGGLVSVIKNEDLECIETECEAIGDQYCKLIIGSENYLKSKYSSLCETQI